VVFEKHTFGYEWEALILKPTMMLLDKDDTEWLSHELRRRLPWSRTGIDMIRRTHAKILEIKSGVMTSQAELVEQTAKHLIEVKNICEEKGWVFLPVGSHPAVEGAIGFHVHIGSVYRHDSAVRLANVFSRYVPAFAALMANSPIWGPLETSGYKSRRVLKGADWCSTITYVMDPDFAQALWGHDVTVTFRTKPTIEVRIADSPFSRELLNEYAVLVSALLFSVSESEELTGSQYVESAENRLRAAKDGLQATFSWNGEAREVTDILHELIERAAPGYEKLNAELPHLIPMMLRKKLTQADFQMLLYEVNPDTHSMSRDLANVIRDDECFTKYMKMADAIGAIPLRSIEDEILSAIGVETPYWDIYASFKLPLARLDRVLHSLEREGRVRCHKTLERGALYTRLST